MIAVHGDDDLDRPREDLAVDVEVEAMGGRWLATFVPAARVLDAAERGGACPMANAVVVPAVSDEVIREVITALVEDEQLPFVFALLPDEDGEEEDGLPHALVMSCDYLASPLWGAETGRNIPLERFGLDERLHAALEGWARAWDDLAFALLDATDDGEDEDDEGDDVPPPPEWQAHQAEGLRIWRRLHEELGDDLEIGFRRSFGVPPGQRATVWDPAREEESSTRSSPPHE